MLQTAFQLAEASLQDLFVPTAFVLLIVAGLIGAVAVIRKRMMANQTYEDPAAGFTLSSLRQLVREGKMSQEEFDKAKSQIVVATQRAAERKAAIPMAKRAPEPKIRPDDPH